ncbi:MAG: cytochrome P450 [Pseudomonadota bacterium]|jgi:cytochrome P450|nr:cytochrome P450 [Pseudomonadota bacterium]MEC7614284.1 cytochrome P450 [Pseudomonadota bacterium]MEC7957954.1 cytochrome P450 [Pseudomonadota bacterium]MEC8020173.1 cytochrome P450 [Pseudomonadota bacterium]MEC8497479.1 cytochrome P450 [Pseudomonadota bacterium]|tara:strand:- start:854 stop:1999 length:1146 start_codon:yes stop_codon:yes gene_type:complete
MQFVTKERLIDPYPDYKNWRENNPIWWAEDVNAWVVSRYKDVHIVLKNPKLFSSAAMGERDHEISLPLLTDDPPRHTKLRAIMNKAFTSRAIKLMENEVRNMSNDLLDKLDISKPVDIAHEFTIPLPISVISQLMGIPFERKDDFKRWSDALTGTGSETEIEKRMPEIINMRNYFLSLIPLRKESPGDDLISKVVNAEVDGETLDENTIAGFNMLLLIAGNETTTNLLSNMLNHISYNPNIWEELRQNKDLVDAAIEETLRFDSPVHWVSRRATKDTELSGQIIKKGENVFAIMGSANRDSSHYENPDEFRLDRKQNKDHHTFGHGIHFCMGAPLARLEGKYALEGLLNRFEEVTPLKNAKNQRTSSSMLRGYHHLWLNLK